MTDITQLGFPTGFLGLDENQSSTNPVGNISIGDYVSAHRKLENTPSGERSKTSSATGPGGLIDSTQQYLQNKYKLPSGYGTNADINDQYDNALITDQQETLKKSNLEPTALNHRLTSWFGSAGGPKVIASNDTESINNILSPDAIKANGLDPKMTVGALKSKVERNLLDQGVNPKFTVGNTNQTASDSPFSVVQDTNKYTPYQAVPLTKPNIKPVFNPNADIPTDVGTAPTTAQPATNLPAYKQAFNKISADNKNNFASNYIKPAINNYLIPAAEPLITAASAIPAVGFGIKSMLTPQSKTQTDAEAAAWKAQNPSESFNPYEQKFIKGMNEHIYQPRNLAAREVVSQAGDVLSQLPPIFPPELNALSSEGQVGKGKVAIKAEAPIATEITPSAEKAAQIASTDTPTYLRKQFAEKQAREQPTTVETAPIEITPQVATENTVKYNPSVGFTAAEYNAEKPLPKQEQMNRLEVLNRIDPNLTVDNNVVEGRGKDRSTDYDHSQKDTPLGNVLSEQFNKEKTSLNNYGEKLINNLGPAKDSEGLGTGGVGLDEASSYVRGKTALDYYQKLETHFDNAISKIYTERDSIAKDIPVNGQNIKHELTDPVTLNLGENAQLAKASTAKLQQLGMMDENGNMLPSNGYTAEQFRKWLNEPDVWDYKNRGLHKKLKDAVDADVISTLDPNTSIYKEARDLWGLKKDTLENPKGIASILDASGPNGINRKVDIEKITKSIETMGVDQFSHMIDTIDKAPPELQVQAQKAKAAIKSQFLNKMHEQFQKNANAGTKFLKENNEVMSRLFDHNEMEKINDYNAGAHILKTDTGYKGAATSFERANRGLLIGAAQEVIKKGAGLAAEAPFGGAAGGILGMMAHNKVSNYFEKGNLENLAQQKENLARQKKEGFTSLSSMNKPKTKTTNKSINFKANENQ